MPTFAAIIAAPTSTRRSSNGRCRHQTSGWRHAPKLPITSWARPRRDGEDGMIPFEMTEPRSLNEAVALLDPEEPTIRPVAGGTALMLMMKAGVFQPTRLICLHNIEPEHARITVTGDALRIGAMATLSDVEHDPNVAKRLPVLKRAMRTLSNVRVRNVARVGGALAHGDPHMDLPPVLAALGARVSIAGPKQKRDLPVDALYAGYYETVLEK